MKKEVLNLVANETRNEVAHKVRQNSSEQVVNNELRENASNEKLIAASIETKENESEKEIKDAFRNSVAENYNEKISSDAEIFDLEKKLAERKKSLLVSSLESVVKSFGFDSVSNIDLSLYGDDVINALWVDALDKMHGFTVDWVASVKDGINTIDSMNNGKLARFAVEVDTNSVVSIVARWRSFLDLARIMSLSSYAPIAKDAAKNKAKADATNAINNAVASGIDKAALLSSLGLSKEELLAMAANM